MEGYKELLNQLSGLVNSLEKGELSLEELNELESVTRTLHERSIILRYKAFETAVNGDSVAEDLEDLREEPEAEAQIESIIPEPAVETKADIEPAEADEPAFDFAIFDEEPAEEEEQVAPEPAAVEPEPIVETEAEIEPIEMKAEEPAIEPEPIEETKEEEVQPESDPTPEPEPEPEPATPSGGSFLDRFALQDNSLAGRFSAGPLDSLIGAFGLNERLRFINDLFDGSSEKFSDAIKALDSQSDLDTARTKVAGYAEENEWDPEEEVVAEFMNYLNRRYA